MKLCHTKIIINFKIKSKVDLDLATQLNLLYFI